MSRFQELIDRPTPVEEDFSVKGAETLRRFIFVQWGVTRMSYADELEYGRIAKQYSWESLFDAIDKARRASKPTKDTRNIKYVEGILKNEAQRQEAKLKQETAIKYTHCEICYASYPAGTQHECALSIEPTPKEKSQEFIRAVEEIKKTLNSAPDLEHIQPSERLKEQGILRLKEYEK